MAQIKKELRTLFESCNTYMEVFQMISTAINNGFSKEEVNTAASWRKNRIAKESQQQYKKISYKEYNISGNGVFVGLPVEERDVNSPVIMFDGSRFVI